MANCVGLKVSWILSPNSCRILVHSSGSYLQESFFFFFKCVRLFMKSLLNKELAIIEMLFKVI